MKPTLTALSLQATTRFIKGKILIFVKTSLQSFIYDVVDDFCFSTQEVKEIYQQSRIIKCFIHLILTDTDSCSLQFIFVCDSRSNISEKESGDLIFKIALQSKLKERLDTSDKIYDQFSCQKTLTFKNKQDCMQLHQLITLT